MRRLGYTTFVAQDPKLIHYNKLPEGGHFAAWKQPAMFVDEMRTSFRSLRQA